MLEVLRIFPRSINEDMNASLDAEIYEAEIEATLFSLKRGKIHSPYGLSVKFYIGFFELVKEDLLKVLCESKRSGKVLGTLNSNFLALIPKKKEVTSSKDFLPISCCNVVYKLI
jgi:hypothetical protein